MGRVLGRLAKIQGIVYYRISHYEQRPFAGLFKFQTAKNFWGRIFSEVPYFGPPFVFTYLLIDWAKKENQRLKTKAAGNVY